MTVDGTTSIHYATPTGLARTAVSLTQELTVEESTVAHITTSSPSRLLLVSDAMLKKRGTTAWPSMNGAYLGHAFLPPHMNGTLRMANPGESVGH